MLAGQAILMGGGSGDFLSFVAFGPLFGPHIAFAGGVAAVAYAARTDKEVGGKDIGVPLIEARALALSDYLCEGLESKGYTIFSSRRPREKSPIVSFYKQGLDLRPIQIELRKQQIVVAYRDGRLRASPHFYNTRANLDRLLDALP